MDTSGIRELNKYGRKIELLAPAGNRDALHAAVENGADAVYLGGRSFSARENADNFDTDMLREELLYAHARGVSLYLTLNTLISDDEMKQALEFAAEVRCAGIDGIIVQDLGLAAALRKVMPDVPLHGSTQMTVYDLAGARVLEDMGFSRAVLARELSLEEIAYIASNTKLEIEAFVHGALCVCYSGQCLMSSMIGGRSGNRGKCAQPCRLPYQLVDAYDGKRDGNIPGRKPNNEPLPVGASGNDRYLKDRSGYLMSPRDMCMLDNLGDIADSGIRSLKIEGRMKSPEYVATVVRIYRKYLDLSAGPDKQRNAKQPAIEDTDRHDLLQIYNRGGFSAGYMKGKIGADMMSYDKPNNSGIYLGKVQAYDSRSQSVTIRLEWDLSIGDGVEIWTGGLDSPGGTVTSIKVGKQNAKTARKGDLAVIGDFKGRIIPGSGVYKTLDIILNRSARDTFSGKIIRRVGITGKAALQPGRPLILHVEDTEGHKVTSEGTIQPEEAINKPLSAERLKEQLSKTGSTPFTFSELEVETADGSTIPVSEINEVRRRALDELYKARAERYPDRRSREDQEGTARRISEAVAKACPPGGRSSGTYGSSKPAISLYFYKWDKDLDYSSLGADRVYLPFVSTGKPGFENTAGQLKAAEIEVFAWLPSITRGNYENLIERFAGQKSQYMVDGILCGNTGTLRKLGKSGLRLAGDISLNIFNTNSLSEAAGLGLESAALSAELTLQQVTCIGRVNDFGTPGKLVLETAVYGRLPLMISEYCPVGCIEGGFTAADRCKGACSKGDFSLRDRKGSEFPVLCDRTDCRSMILNSNVLFVPDIAGDLADSGIKLLRLYIWDEKPEQIRELVRLYKDARPDIAGKPAGIKTVDMLKGSGYTKGHYFRGV